MEQKSEFSVRVKSSTPPLSSPCSTWAAAPVSSFGSASREVVPNRGRIIIVGGSTTTRSADADGLFTARSELARQVGREVARGSTKLKDIAAVGIFPFKAEPAPGHC